MRPHWFLVSAFISVCCAYRLPKTVFPTHYKIEILTNLGDYGSNDTFDFVGHEWIDVKCAENTSRLTLHSKGLNISGSKIRVLENDKDLRVQAVALQPEVDFLYIDVAEPLQVGHEYRVFIPFQANISRGLTGYYLSSYNDTSTQAKKYLTVTQFESTYAREAFPCWDEPEYKAVFELTLGRHERLTSLSNMPIASTVPMEERTSWYWDHFQPSKRMSTYLLAYILSEFKSRDSPNQSHVRFAIWSRPDAYEQTVYAADIGPKVLAYYENYFDLEYPLPKQDMVAIPDFSSGAMENWGLITYREKDLLYEPGVSSLTNKDRVASVIAHELAHQWFGNLVTMKWWTDLWLNEGFATYVSSLGVNHVEPEWEIIDTDGLNNLVAVLDLDALRSSHPVSVPIGHPKEIGQIFDFISYRKGSFLIRMMNMFLGEEVFKTGVSKYLKRHQYGNAEQDHLWDSLTTEAHHRGVLNKNITVKQIMDTWTLQTGFPLITVNRDYEQGTANISQKRYFQLEDDLGDKSCWHVPITYTNAAELAFTNTTPKMWLDCSASIKPQEIQQIAKADDWILLNLKASGLYRVMYDEQNWHLLTEFLNKENFEKISPINRAQLVDDVLTFAWSGRLSYKTALELISFLDRERSHLTWDAAIDSLQGLSVMLRSTEANDYFKDFMRSIISPLYNQFNGFLLDKKDSNNLGKVRLHKIAVSWACKLEVLDCVPKAKELFNQWMAHPDTNPIPVDLRSSIYCTAIKHGGPNHWEFIWQRYEQSNVASEKQIFISSLGCSRNATILQRYLNFTITPDSGIRSQDNLFVFGAVAHSKFGHPIAKKFLLENIQTIYSTFGQKETKLGMYLRYITSSLTKDSELDEVRKFASINNALFESSTLIIKQSFEAASDNIKWHKTIFNNLSNYLLVRYKRV